MSAKITCPHCHQSFEPSQAFKHELEETLLKENEVKHQQEIERLLKQQAIKQQQIEANTLQKVTAEFEAKNSKELKDKQEQIVQLTKRAEVAEAEELKIRKQKRELEEAKRTFELDKQRQLDEERSKIREEAEKQFSEIHNLKDKEKDKKITDLMKSLEEAKRKAEQGSQQTQGEVLELEIEQLLKQTFPTDHIDEVKKGQRGADIIQTIIDKRGKNCGTVLWESKNAVWSNSWIPKLKEDQRQAKAHLAVLVSTDQKETDSFIYKDGIWITTRAMIAPLATALRYNLIKVFYERQSNTGKNEKMEVLYTYITSLEFKHRIEAIMESFTTMQQELEREKRWFQTKWSRQEKQLRHIIDHTHGMWGDLQGVVGQSLPEVKTLELDA